jgi:hypothetical protein
MNPTRIRNLPIVACVFATSFAFAATVQAQSFFGGGAVAYDPEISTVQSGGILDAQVVVSYDRKYVTIGAQATEQRLLALRDFQIAAPANQGFVGGVTPVGGGAGGTGSGGNAGGGFSSNGGATSNAPAAEHTRNRRDANQAVITPSASPAEVERRAIGAKSILSLQGMFLLKPL